MATTLVFNALMLVVDVAILRRLRITPTFLMAFALAVATAVAALLLAMLLGHGARGVMRLGRTGRSSRMARCFSLGAAVIFWQSRRGLSLVAGLVAVGLVVVAADAFLIEPHWLEVSHVRISSPKLTRPRRIVVLADIQVDSLGPYEREVIAKVAEALPDVVLLAGDYIQAAPGTGAAPAQN